MNLSRRAQEIRPFFVMDILARARAMESEGRDVIHMEIGEPDFPTPSLVVEAALRFIRNGDVKYTPAGGLPELRESIAAYYKQRYGVSVGVERVFITPGATGGLLLAMGLLLGAGDRVGLTDPGYPCYSNFVRLYDGQPRLIPVDEATGFHLNADLLRDCWDDRMTGVVIASPANPTGAVIAPDVFRELMAYIERQGGFVVSDEIYHGLEYGQPSITALAFSPRAFVVNSFSKYFGMTGWRLGWVVVPEEYVSAAERLAQNIFISAPTHSQVAALASFNAENQLELERRRLVLGERRDLLCERLSGLGFSINARPDGAFYVYADCSRFSPDSQALAKRLLKDAGVAITPGLDFGVHRPEVHLRFCYTLAKDRLIEGMDRIAEFLRRFRTSG